MDIELLELRELAKNREKDQKNEGIDSFTESNFYCLLVFLALIVVFMLMGCQPGREISHPKYYFSNGVVPLAARAYPEMKTGTFLVRLQWHPSDLRPIGWLIRRVKFGSDKTIQAVRQEGTNVYRDDGVRAGRYRYLLSTIDETGEKVVATLEVFLQNPEVFNAKQ